MGRPLRSALGARGFRATEPVLRQVFRTGQAHEEIVEAERVYHVRRLPLRRGRQVTHVVSWFEDITDRRDLEMRLIAADRYAFLGQFLSGVAHEISNPLAGIAGCAEALASLAAKGDAANTTEARQFRDLIRSEVARCEGMVRSVLDAARPQSRATANVAETVTVALRLLERHPSLARVRVRQSVPRSVPDVRIDPESLKQVVMALATGAARAMATGGTLTVRARRAGRAVLLDVVDTAPPVPADRRGDLFEPFATVDVQRGAGLGLAISRSLLRGHGGDLVYRPRKTGNAFRVILQAVSGRS